jgi:hypothetical protein
VTKQVDGDGSAGLSLPRELQLFSEQRAVATHLECHICIDKVPYRPVSTGCHVFCKHCWDLWVLSSTTPLSRDTVSCPACRTSVLLSKMRSVDHLLQRLLAHMRVNCPNRVKGCSAVLEFGMDGETVSAHVKNACAWGTARCPQCDWTGGRAALPMHNCRPRLSCAHPGCQYSTDQPRSLSSHMSNCPRELLLCGACNDTHQRSAQAYHSSKQCIYRCKHCHQWLAESRKAEHEQNPRYRLCSFFSPCANGCGQPVRRGVQDKHDDTCEEAIVICNLDRNQRRCRARLKRKNWGSHVDKVHGGDNEQHMSDSEDDRMGYFY